jgi:hypothetical protein
MCQEFTTCTNPVDQDQETKPEEDTDEAEEVANIEEDTTPANTLDTSGFIDCRNACMPVRLPGGKKNYVGCVYACLHDPKKFMAECRRKGICTWPESMEAESVEENK